METLVGKFSFTVPTPTPEEIAAGQVAHADAGKEIEKAFEYKKCQSEDEARAWLDANKKVSILSLVNDKLKKDARSNAYQAATLVYRPSEVPVDDIYERMRRDAIRNGASEAIANAMVENLKAQIASARQATPAAETETPATE